jgi:hypothetical protein
LKFIISKSNNETFDRDKVFETERIESVYNYLAANADKGRLISFDALKYDVELVSDMRPMYGFYIKEDGDDVLYMKVIKE